MPKVIVLANQKGGTGKTTTTVNLGIGLAMQGNKVFLVDADRLSRSKELCTFLGINEEEKVKKLSKGTKERVLIMLTFSRNARLYLLDEPLGGIDPLTRNKIVKTIFSGASRGSTIMISTHLVADVETLLDDVLFWKQRQAGFFRQCGQYPERSPVFFKPCRGNSHYFQHAFFGVHLCYLCCRTYKMA